MANTKVSSEQIIDDVALAGNPTTTTQGASDNSTKVATTAYVTTAVANLIDSAPSSLNTLNELAAAMNDNASFFSTVLPLSGGTMTGALNMGSQNITNAGTIASGAITSSGNAHVGDSTNISMDQSANGQLEVDGNGYQGAIALDGSAMHVYHNSASRSLVLGTNDTARLTISGSGAFDFHSNNLSSVGTIASSNASITSTGNGLTLSRSGYDTYALQHSTGSGIAIYNVTDSRSELFFAGDGTATFAGAVMIGGTLHNEWHSDYVGVEIGHSGFVFNRTAGNELFATSNAYYDSGWKFAQSGRASMLDLQSGRIRARTSNASGSQDGAITWVTALDITADNGAATFSGPLTVNGKINSLVDTNKNLRTIALTCDNFANEGVGISFSRTSSDSALMAVGVVQTDQLAMLSRSGIVFAVGGSSLYSQTSKVMEIQNDGDLIHKPISGNGKRIQKVLPRQDVNYPSSGQAGTAENWYQPARGESGIITYGNINTAGGEYRCAGFIVYSAAEANNTPPAITIAVTESVGANMVAFDVSAGYIRVQNTYGYGIHLTGFVDAVIA